MSVMIHVSIMGAWQAGFFERWWAPNSNEDTQVGDRALCSWAHLGKFPQRDRGPDQWRPEARQPKSGDMS
jgi:hypothetical protein